MRRRVAAQREARVRQAGERLGEVRLGERTRPVVEESGFMSRVTRSSAAIGEEATTSPPSIGATASPSTSGRSLVACSSDRPASIRWVGSSGPRSDTTGASGGV